MLGAAGEGGGGPSSANIENNKDRTPVSQQPLQRHRGRVSLD